MLPVFQGMSRAGQAQKLCFLNFTLQSVLCARNVSDLLTGMLLALRSLYLLVQKLGDGLLCPDVLPPSCLSLLPPFPGSAGVCCRVLGWGACTAQCHLRVPGR